MAGVLADLLYETPKAYWGPKLSSLLDSAQTGANAYAGAPGSSDAQALRQSARISVGRPYVVNALE